MQHAANIWIYNGLAQYLIVSLKQHATPTTLYVGHQVLKGHQK